MKKLLILGFVLCFTGAASAATVTVTAVVNEFSPGLAGWDADPNTNYVVIHLTVPATTAVAGLDIQIATPGGATATDDVVMKNIGFPPVSLPVGVDLASAFGYGDDRESWLNDGMLPQLLLGDNPHTAGIAADGIAAYSGNPASGFAYTFDGVGGNPAYLSTSAYISGGNVAGIGPGSHILAAIGYDGIDNVSLIKGLAGAFSIGPGGFSALQGFEAIDKVVFPIIPPEPTTMLLLLAGVVAVIRRKK